MYAMQVAGRGRVAFASTRTKGCAAPPARTCHPGRPLSKFNASCGCQTPRLGLLLRSPSKARCPRLAAGGEADKDVQYNTEFGYSRKDVLLIGVGLLALGYGLYYGLQAAGVQDFQAGLYTQLVMVLLLSVGWVSTYLFRVATKQMTYTQQLQAYEEAVMKARLKEMTEEEVESLMNTVESEKKAFEQQQQQK